MPFSPTENICKNRQKNLKEYCRNNHLSVNLVLSKEFFFSGENEKLTELMLEGYDHIVDAQDNENIFVLTQRQNNSTTISLLSIITTFEVI